MAHLLPFQLLPDVDDLDGALGRAVRWGRSRYAAATTFLVAAGLRLYRLGDESLWLDEAASVSFVTRQYTTGGLLLELPTQDMHPPLYYLLLDGWTAVFGVGEAALRFPSAVLGWAVVVLTYVLGVHLFDRTAGIVSAALVAISSFHIHYSQEARMYSLLAALSLASFLLLVQVLRETTPDRRTTWGYVATTALLGYSHVFGLLVVLAQNVYAVPRLLLGPGSPSYDTPRRLPSPLRRWIGLQAAVGFLLGPYLLVLLARLRTLTGGGESRISWIPAPDLGDLATTVQSYLAFPGMGGTLGPFTSVGAAVAAGAAALAVGLSVLPLAARVRGGEVRRGPTPWTPMLALWFLIPVAGPYLVSLLVTPVYQHQYTIGASVALFLLVGAGTSSLRRLLQPASSPLGAHHLAAGLLLAATAAPLPGYYAVDQKDQWREAVAEVESSAQPGALVIVSESYTVKPYRYYADRTDLTVAPMDADAEAQRIDARTEGHDAVWVVLNHARDAAIVDHLRSTEGGFDRVYETT